MLLALAGCDSRKLQRGPGATPSTAASAESDEQLDACAKEWSRVEQATALVTPELNSGARAQLLGRARGAVAVFIREPATAANTADARAELGKTRPGYRVARYLAQHKRDKARLRDGLLVEGYLYATEPEDAFELEARVSLDALYDTPRLVIERGEQEFVAVREKNRYVFESGPLAGQPATIQFADRLRPEGEPANPPLVRDVAALMQREGFDRLQFQRMTAQGHLASLHFGELTVRAVLRDRGAALHVQCLNEPADVRSALAAGKPQRDGRTAMRNRLSEAITEQVALALPFDRPREEKGPDRDGELRPHWTGAYLRGQHSFRVDESTYPVFDATGRARPPQVCVDFVVESFERASGASFAPRGGAPKITRGGLEFNKLGVKNARGVLGFGAFGQEHPELFDGRTFAGEERIPFAKREAFFKFLQDRPGDFQPGDILAIQGLKADGRVHQHAILLEAIDPLTGFPYGLADQMKAPRRRSWEGIMAEAPKRSLLYRLRPKQAITSLIVDRPTTLARQD